MLIPGNRDLFPALKNSSRVYLDNAATTHKPVQVLDTIRYFYENLNAPADRSTYKAAETVSRIYEKARHKAALFTGTEDPDEIIFTRGATDSINIAAASLARSKDKHLAIKPGDEIIVTRLEHNSNLLPWYELCRAKGAALVYAEPGPDGIIDPETIRSLITDRTRLIACTHVSNLLGTINPVKKICAFARAAGVLTFIDGAAAAPHLMPEAFKNGFDFYAFSGHKMLGPSGIGVLYAKRELLEKMEPVSFGGGTVKNITSDGPLYSGIPARFEAGSPDVCSAAAFAGSEHPETGEKITGALDLLQSGGMEALLNHERSLVSEAMERLSKNPAVKIYGTRDVQKKTGTISFNIMDGDKPADSHLAGALLSDMNIEVRTGAHCAHTLTGHLAIEGTIRAGFYVYNNMDDVDRLCEAIETAVSVLL